LPRRPPAHGRAADRRHELLGRQHARRLALERDDDRRRQGAAAARKGEGVVPRIAIFGAGYVGLVTGACFADLGHEVVVRDILPERIEDLRAGRLPIHEPGLEELLAKNAERLTFTLDVAEALDGAEFGFVAVGTPPTYSGDADLSAVWTV